MDINTKNSLQGQCKGHKLYHIIQLDIRREEINRKGGEKETEGGNKNEIITSQFTAGL